MRKWLIMGLSVALLGTGFTFKTWRGQLAQGNHELEQGRTAEAIAAYQEGLVNAPDEPRIHYNLGNAFYAKGDFGKAGEHFKKALDLSAKKELHTQAEYNLANSLYRHGAMLEEEQPNEAVKKYETALQHYKNAIEANPKDSDAKYNYEFVKKQLDELKEKLQNQQKQDQNQQNDQNKAQQQDEKNGQNDRKNDGEDQRGDQPDQQNDQQQNGQGDQQDQQQNGQDSQRQNQQDQDQQPAQAQTTGPDQSEQSDQTGTGSGEQDGALPTDREDGTGMTRAQALQLLEQFEDQGEQLVPVMPKENPGRSYKDW